MSTRLVLLALTVIVATVTAGVINDENKVQRAEHMQRLRDKRPIEDEPSQRIIGGYEADPGQFPYQVSIRDVDFGHFCGGSIISNRWIMTAQHCVQVYENPNYIQYLFIVAGTHSTKRGGVEYTVDLVVNYPDFSWFYLKNDISLVRTRSWITFGDLVAAIPFNSEHVGAGVPTRTSGWGSTKLWGDTPEYLKFLDLVSLRNLDCESRVSDGLPITNDMLCAYSMEDGRGICHGDSGSPMTVNGVVVGISSWVIPCARGRPDGFVRVSHFYDWILETIENVNDVV